MSGRAQSWAKQVRTGSAARKALLIMMADEASDQGHLYGYGSITGAEWNYRLEHYARLAEMGRSTAYRHVAALKDAVLIVVDQQGGITTDGSKLRTKLRLNIPADFSVLANGTEVFTVSDEQSQCGTEVEEKQSQNGTDSSPTLGQGAVPKRDSTQSYIPKLISQELLADDLPVLEIRECLPAELQNAWPVVRELPPWVPVLVFAQWCQVSAGRGKRVMPMQVPAMLRLWLDNAQLAQASPRDYLALHLAQGWKNLRQVEPNELKPQDFGGRDDAIGSDDFESDNRRRAFDYSEFD